MQLTLSVHYADGYPDELPELSLEAIQGDLEDSELKELLAGLRAVVWRNFRGIF